MSKKKTTRARERSSTAPFTARILIGHESHPLLRPDRVSSAFNVQATTDLDLLAQLLFSAVDVLGFAKDGRMLVGAIASVINTMHIELRKQVVGHVLAGNNLYVNRASQYNCKECGREDLGDDGAHEEAKREGDTEEPAAPCTGTPKEEETWVITTGKCFEPLIEVEGDKDDAPSTLWKPGDPA